MAAATLAATLGAAGWLVARQRQPVPLGPAIQPPKWPLAFGPPKDWRSQEPSDAEPGSPPWRDDLTFVGRRADGSPLLLTVALRYLPGIPHPRFTALQALDENFRGETRISQSVRSQSVGGLFGEAVRAVFAGVPEDHFAIAAAACLPNGRAATVLLQGVGRPLPSDDGLVRTVCQSVRWTGVSLQKSQPADAPRPGLRIEAPTGLACVVDPEDGAASVYLTATDASAVALQVRVYPTFLASGRDLEGLLEDYLVYNEIRVRPEARVETMRMGAFNVAHAFQTFGAAAVDAFAVDLGSGRAALVVAAGLAQDHAAMERLGRRVVSRLTVDKGTWPYDPAAAAVQGAVLVRELERRGIDATGPEAESSAWVGYVGGQMREHTDVSWVRPDQPGGRLAGTLTTVQYDADGETNVELTRRWEVEATGGAFRSTEEIAIRREARVERIHTELERAAESGEVRYAVRAGAERGTLRFEPSANFVPDPLIDALVARAAHSEPPRDALYESMSLSPRGTTRLYVRPVPLDADRDGPEAARAVVYLFDFAPFPTRAVFARDGRLIREDLHWGAWRVRDTPERGRRDMSRT